MNNENYKKEDYKKLTREIAHYLIGNTCPLNCDFCFWEKRYNDIKTSDKKRIIDQISNVGFKGIIFSGGDPSYCKDLIKILEYSKSKKLFVSLHTTGLNINKKKALELTKHLDILSLTIDGSNDKKVFNMRKNKILFQKTISLIKFFNKSGVNVDIKTIVTLKNYDDIENIARLLKNYKIHEWYLFEFTPLNKAKEFMKDFYIPTKKYDALIFKLKKKYPKLKINDCRSSEMPENTCFINVIGEVYTFKKQKGDVIKGNLKNNSLKEIIKSF